MRQRIGQAGIRGARVSGKYAPFSIGAPAECVVIAVYYIDDKQNVSQTFTEYDCKDLRTGQIYKNVRRLDSVAGMDDGSEQVLRPAQQLVGATSTTFDPKIDQLSQSDGDRVQVSFNYGAQHTAVISDVLPHPKMKYGTTKAQGRRKFETHQGTSVETKADGSYQIKRNDTTITLNADETIDIVHKSGSVMHFRDNGDIEVTANRDVIVDGQAVKAGANAIQPVIRGTDLNANVLTPVSTAATTALGAFAAAVTALNVPPVPTPADLKVAVLAIAAALIAEDTALVAALAAYPSTLSQKTSTE